MEGTTEKDCSPLWNLYQQIVSDMKVGHALFVCKNLGVYVGRYLFIYIPNYCVLFVCLPVCLVGDRSACWPPILL